MKFKDYSEYSFALVTNLTRSGSTATAETPAEHGYSSGELITVNGADQPEYNGDFYITVTDTTHFTYVVSGTPATPATGLIASAQQERHSVSVQHYIDAGFDVSDFVGTELQRATDWTRPSNRPRIDDSGDKLHYLTHYDPDWIDFNHIGSVLQAFVDDEMVWEFKANLQTLEPSVGTGTLTFTRTGVATRVNVSGLIESVAINTPRFDYDPATLTFKGLLVEESRTNLIIRAEEFDNAAWTKTDTTVTPNDTVAPDGATTADLLTEGTAGTARTHQSYTATADSSQAWSLFMKRGNHDWVQMRITETADAGNRINGWFNLATGALGTASNTGTGAGATIKIKSYGNGWYRCTLIGSVNNAATALSAWTQSADADNSIVRVSSGTRYQWGGQVENNTANETSYIPTAASTVNRGGDVCTVLLSEILGASTATLTAVVKAYQGSTANTSTLLSIDNGASSERFVILTGSSGDRGRTLIIDGGVTQFDQSSAGGSWPAGTLGKAGLTAELDNSNFAVAGVMGAGSTSCTMPTPTTLRIGCRFDDTQQWNSHIVKISLYNTRKSNGFTTGATTP